MIYLVSAIALIAAIIAIWFFQESRKVAQECEHLKTGKNAADLEKQAQVDVVENLRMEKEKLNEAFITMKAESQMLNRQLYDQKRQFVEQKEALEKQLQLMGKNLVEEGSKTLKSESQQKLGEILAPFKEKLEKFEKEVRDNRETNTKQFSNMEAVVKTLSEQHDKINSTAQNLVEALRGENKVQGDWGEMALERILESSGLIKGQEYFTQNSARDENQNLMRPDVVIHLPDNKHIVIDSKVSLKAFERFINEEDPALKKTALSAHLLSLKTHIKQLGEKDYAHLADFNSPEFTLLFIPLESSFALAIKEEPGLYEMAMERKIVLVTPSTLMATLKTVNSIWKHERTNKNAVEIARQAGNLYDKFEGFVKDLEKIGKKQDEMKMAYSEAMNKLTNGNGNLITRVEKLRELGVKTKKNLDKKYLDDEQETEFMD